MIARLNRRSKQCSSHPSYPVRAAHQIPIIHLRSRAYTISMSSHHAIFFSTSTPSSAPLSFSLLKNRSTPPPPESSSKSPFQRQELSILLQRWPPPPIFHRYVIPFPSPLLFSDLELIMSPFLLLVRILETTLLFPW